jgi:hypothetical protein
MSCGDHLNIEGDSLLLHSGGGESVEGVEKAWSFHCSTGRISSSVGK